MLEDALADARVIVGANCTGGNRLQNIGSYEPYEALLYVPRH